MISFRENIEGKFNAVIEGSYHDSWDKLNYKIAKVDLEGDADVLNDRTYRYRLYGRTGDFDSFEVLDKNSKGLEKNLKGFLGFCEGIVLPFRGGNYHHLERPRLVCMRDGRFFVEEDMLSVGSYLGSLDLIVKTIGPMFDNEELSELYGCICNP